jgi:hypothetical protein
MYAPTGVCWYVVATDISQVALIVGQVEVLFNVSSTQLPRWTFLMHVAFTRASRRWLCKGNGPIDLEFFVVAHAITASSPSASTAVSRRSPTAHALHADAPTVSGRNVYLTSAVVSCVLVVRAELWN